jgi:hypothetical protein
MLIGEIALELPLPADLQVPGVSVVGPLLGCLGLGGLDPRPPEDAFQSQPLDSGHVSQGQSARAEMRPIALDHDVDRFAPGGRTSLHQPPLLSVGFLWEP